MIHSMPSVAKFISISDNYFDYVTSTNGVFYYKIYCDGVLTGGIHCEINNGIMFLSICIDEKYRRNGIAKKSLNQLFLKQTTDIDFIEVSIDDSNIASLSLFQKLGFLQTGKEDELITMRKSLH